MHVGVTNMLKLKQLVSIGLVIVISYSSGVFIPAVVQVITEVDMSTIRLPGIPINATVFSSLQSDDMDPIILTGNWSKASMKTPTYHLVVEESRISDVEGKQIAFGFISTELKPCLEDHPDSPKTESRHVYSRYIFFNGSFDGLVYHYDLYVMISVNMITGRVSEYYEVASPHFITQHPEVFKPANPDYSLIDASAAENASFNLLLEHNYTLPASTRHLNTRLEFAPIGTEFDQHENYSRPIYMVELGVPKNRIFPPKREQGPRFEVDATTGRVFWFSYFALDIPQTDPGQIVDSNVARNAAISYVGEENYSETAVFLRFQRNLLSHWDYSLVWSFDRELQQEWGIHVEEIVVDAYTGQLFYPEPYLYGNRIIGSNSMVTMVIIILSSVAIASLGYIGIRKKVHAYP